MMAIESTTTRRAIAAALQIIDANLVTFAQVYPDDTTVHNIYPPRKPLFDASMAEGTNWGWTTGFWPGMIWLAYELTGDDRYRQAGEGHIGNFTDRIERRIWVDHHDLGFLYTLTCVAPWRLLGHQSARRTALQAADLLMMRFWDKPGIFQAWGAMTDPNERGRTIVDSLMNMPLLYWASETTGDSRYATAAHRHACQLAAHALRPDGSTFHTYYFDTETGALRFVNTSQGHADDSCWARGQAWTVYGFTLNYASTRDEALLRAAQVVTDCFLVHLPSDHVACWDLVFGDCEGEERDSSAAAIATCGLLELVRWLPHGPQRSRYEAAAEAILASLIANYAGHAPETNALLLHGVYSKPHGAGMDEGNLWGDYYYLEALTRVVNPDWRPYW
jgi:unsaturated chondroitin disaccharide hydrolase